MNRLEELYQFAQALDSQSGGIGTLELFIIPVKLAGINASIHAKANIRL
jgi:hypothetical protein